MATPKTRSTSLIRGSGITTAASVALHHPTCDDGEHTDHSARSQSRVRALHISLLVLLVIHASFIFVPALWFSSTAFASFLVLSMMIGLYARRRYFRNLDHYMYGFLLALGLVTGWTVSQRLLALLWLCKILLRINPNSIQQYVDGLQSAPIRAVVQWAWTAFSSFSGPQLHVNALAHYAVDNDYCYSCSLQTHLWGMELHRPTFRSRLLNPEALASGTDWMYCWANTPAAATGKFLTQVTCGRTLPDDLINHQGPRADIQRMLDGPFYGSVYSFLKQPPKTKNDRDIVEELRNIFKEQVTPSMRAIYNNNKTIIPHTIEYLDANDPTVVTKRVTKQDESFSQHVHQLELARFHHDFAGIHLLVHVWFEDYIVQAERHLHPSDVVLHHFHSVGMASGYHASVGPLSFDQDVNAIGKYFQFQQHTYLGAFDMEKCDHLHADVVKFIQQNGTEQVVESCRVTMMYAKALRLYFQQLLGGDNTRKHSHQHHGNQVQDDDSKLEQSIQEGRQRLLDSLNQLHNTKFTNVVDLATNQLLLVVQHSLIHIVSARRARYVDGGNFALSFTAGDIYLFTLDSVIVDLPNREELRNTFLPPQDVEYGIQE